MTTRLIPHLVEVPVEVDCDRVELAMRFGRSVEVGDRLEVKVAHADPRRDEIIFQEIVSSVAETATN